MSEIDLSILLDGGDFSEMNERFAVIEKEGRTQIEMRFAFPIYRARELEDQLRRTIYAKEAEAAIDTLRLLRWMHENLAANIEKYDARNGGEDGPKELGPASG